MRCCRISNCENKHLAKGYCSKHYQRIYKNGTLTPKVERGVSAYNRVLKKSKENKNGCLIFQGCKTSNGYGHVRDDNRMKMAHRVTWEHHNGLVPEDMELDHLCKERACVNHEHLEIVYHVENVRRGNAGHDHITRDRDEFGKFCKKGEK